MKNISNITNVDANLKKELDLLFKSLCIPFEIYVPKPSRNLKKALKEAASISNGKRNFKTYRDVEEIFEDILNEK